MDDDFEGEEHPDWGKTGGGNHILWWGTKILPYLKQRGYLDLVKCSSGTFPGLTGEKNPEIIPPQLISEHSLCHKLEPVHFYTTLYNEPLLPVNKVFTYSSGTFKIYFLSQIGIVSKYV